MNTIVAERRDMLRIVMPLSARMHTQACHAGMRDGRACRCAATICSVCGNLLRDSGVCPACREHGAA